MPPSAIEQSGSGARILVVDDEPGMRDMLSFELSAHGYQVVTAENGMEALEQFKRQAFDLVISDLKMPKMDGMALLDELTKVDPSIEVIMATGFGTVETAVEAMKKGAYGFIQKPFNLDEAYALIERALEKSELKMSVALYELSRAVFSTMHLDELLKIVMGLLQRALKPDEASLMLLDEAGKLYIAASLGLSEDIIKQPHVAIGERIAGRAAKERKMWLLIGGVDQYPEFKGVESNPRIGSSLIVPLLHKEELLGVLNLSRLTAHERFTSSDLRHASVFASQVAQATRNVKLYEHLKETQDQLIQAEKLSAIGQLSAGVAHELKNPLAIILQGVEFLKRGQGAAEAERALALSSIDEAVTRADRIIHGVMTLAKPTSLRVAPTNLHDVLDKVLGLVEQQYGFTGITVVKEWLDRPPLALIDAGQMEQVLINLIANAIQAMPQGGRLTLRTAVAPAQFGEGVGRRALDFFQIGEQAMLCEIEDTGVGIPEDALRKVFDPFFTTKPPGKGTGLGLAIVHAIIDAHRGLIRIDRAVGRGTTVRILLHLAEQAKS